MARLKVLKELDAVERQADGYLVLNTLLNIAVQITSIYVSIELSTYIWRIITAPC